MLRERSFAVCVAKAVSMATPFLAALFLAALFLASLFLWLRCFSLRCFYGFAVSMAALFLASLFNFVEGFAVQWLRRLNACGVCRYAVSAVASWRAAT